MGLKAVVFAAEHAVPAKLEAMRVLGAEVRLVPGGYEQAEKTGIQFAAEQGMTWISPYNDGQVIAGQATVGVELLQDILAEDLEAVVVPVGGGGLIAGIGLALQQIPRGHRPRLIGVQSEASPYFHALLKDGSQDGVVETDSLADGLAGRVEDNAITIPLVRRSVDDIRLVSEDEIARAVAYAWTHYGQRIEGSAAVGLAGGVAGKFSQRPAALVISGGNIQPQLHEQLVQRWSRGEGTSG